MKQTDNISQLVEKAVSAMQGLNPMDTSAVESLQATLDEIRQHVSKMAGPAELLKQANGMTFGAAEQLEKILRNQIVDTNKAVGDITNALSALQEVVSQFDTSPSGPQTTAGDSTCQSVQSTSEQGAAIQEADIPLLQDFVAESAEHIESAEAGLLELEERPGDKEVLNQIFRGFHTIKGMAGFLNLTEIGSLAHAAENLLDLARKGELVLAGENTDMVFESIDMMKKMVSALADCLKSGSGGTLVVPRQNRLAQLLTKIKAAAEGQALAGSLKTSDGQKKDEKLDQILQSGEKSGDSDQQSARSAGGVASDEKIKVSTTRLDNLINMAGELAIAQLMVAEAVNTTLAGENSLVRKVSHQSKIVREIQELSMAMRMVPIHGVFQKMARLARDLSHKCNKQVNLVTSGDETELDRSIVDKIADPLVHMVRNSLDHGIEPAEERLKNGKSAVGRIELRAFHQAGNIVIEIEDDGKGLNKDKILSKAIECGFADPNQELSEEEIFKLIFHAGLSTAEKVTSVSGRGVGMDVVRKNIEVLRGKIEIRSVLGKGTTFTIRLPLTLAIIDGQIVRIGDERYIVPINAISQSLRPTREQISSVQNRAEMIIVRGQLIPMVRLYRVFSLVPRTEDPTESLVVIVEEEGKKCALLVDELMGQQQVLIKSLGAGLGIVRGVAGGAIMGDGRISLILDVPGLIELSRNQKS